MTDTEEKTPAKKREMRRETLSFPGYAEHVELEDGVPIRYSCLGSSLAKSQEPALAARIEALCGQRVRFGTWIDLQGDPRDGGAEVDLLPPLADGDHEVAGLDRFGDVVVIAEGRPVRFKCLLGPPYLDEAERLGSIETLTGFRVRFGAWREMQGAMQVEHEAELVVDL